MNVAAMFALVVVFTLVGVRSLNTIGVKDEAAVMNEMPAETRVSEMEMATEEAGYGDSTEKAAPKLMESTMEIDDSVKESEDASLDKADSHSDTSDGGTLETEETAEMATIMFTEEAEPVADMDQAEEEAQLTMAGAAVEGTPHLVRTEETEVSTYKAKDHEALTINESKTYSGQGTIEGHEYLVWLLFGSFVAITGLGGFVIMRRRK